MSDKIRIAGLEIACIVGIRPSERRRPQRVRLHLELELDLSRAGKSGRIVETVDYSRVAAEIESLLRFRAYKLVEVAAEEISAAVLAMHTSVERVTLQIEKPEALRGHARSASVEITRARPDLRGASAEHVGYESELRLLTHEAELSLITLAGHAALPAGVAADRRRIEWLTSGRLLVGEHELTPGAARVSEDGRPENVRNPGSESAVLFRCIERAELTSDFSESP